MEDDLIAAHGDVPQLMPYLHLPVQSGSDRILKAMNRKHTAEQYLRLIERIRAARPDILLSSDFIVGFPGETDQDFADTMDLIRAVGFGQAFSFKYSARPGTPAAEKPELPAEVADARLQSLQALVTQQQRAAQEAMVGREVGVLYERPGACRGRWWANPITCTLSMWPIRQGRWASLSACASPPPRPIRWPRNPLWAEQNRCVSTLHPIRGELWQFSGLRNNWSFNHTETHRFCFT